MYENEIVEVVNGRANEALKQWYDAKVKDLALLLVERLEFQNIQIQKLKLEKNIQNLPLEIPEEVLVK